MVNKNYGTAAHFVDIRTAVPYVSFMHTVIETSVFERQARNVPDEELRAIIAEIAENPIQGNVIKGTGGARKVRFRTADKGKSGGYRTNHYFAG